MQRLDISLQQKKIASEILIGRGICQQVGQAISNATGLNPRRIALVSNPRVFSLYGVKVRRALKSEGFDVHPWLISDGERFKSFRTLQTTLDFLGDIGFERNDVVVALGGGVVGDLAGFAAAVYLRGVSLVQLPTTLLAQIDSSVGGKTGINLTVGKNMVGAFHQPSLVLIDPETLVTLPQRELVAGFCEMVKQSLVADRSLFDTTVTFLRTTKNKSDFLLSAELEELITANCAFKASIVANDERESTDRSDSKSRRVLNFGHTTAHALESITNYRKFRHGEAVGYGMLVAGELSKNLGLLDPAELELLRDAVHLCGSRPRADKLDINEIMRALEHDKKSVGGQINWVLLEGVGSPRIVEGRLISKKVLRLSLRAALQPPVRQKESSTNE
jgi:3-dehydroquinate synthase